MVTLRGIQWSAQEQLYPLEKDGNGGALYFKELSAPNGPNNSTIFVPHGLSPFDGTKIKRLTIRLINSSSFLGFPDGGWNGSTFDTTHSVDSTNINLVSTRNLSSYAIRIELIYSK